MSLSNESGHIGGWSSATGGREPHGRARQFLLAGMAVLAACFLADVSSAEGARSDVRQELAQDNAAPARNRLDWPSAWKPVDAEAGALRPDPGEAARRAQAGAQEEGIAQPGSAAEPVSPPGLGTEASPSAPEALADSPPASPSNAPATEAQQPPPAAPQLAAPPSAAPSSAGQPVPQPATPPADAKKPAEEPAKDVVKIDKAELPADIQEAIKPVAALEAQLEGFSKTVERVKERDDELVPLQPQIEALVASAQKLADSLRPRLDDIESQKSKLGPEPGKEGAGPESSEIANERARLNELSAAVAGAIKKAELVQVRGRQLVGRIVSLRQSIFARDILARTKSPLNPGVLSQAYEGLPGAGNQIAAIARQWYAKAAADGQNVLLVLLGALLTYFVVKLVRRRLFTRRLSQPATPPDFFDKALAAGLYGPLNALPSLAALAVVYFGLDALSLLYLQAGSFVENVIVAFLTWKVSSSLARAYLQPRRPLWRIAEVDDASARRIYWTLQAIAAVFAIDIVLRGMISDLFLPLPVRVIATFLVSMAFAVLFIVLARTPVPKSQTLTSGVLTGVRPEYLKLPLFLIAFAVIVASLTGYVALGRYLAGQVILTSSALLLIATFFVSIRGIAEQPEHLARLGSRAGDTYGALGLTEEQNKRIVQVIVALLYCVLAALAPVLVLFSLGFSWIEISSVIDRALFGFEVGGVRVSLIKVAIAVAIFTGILLATRTVQSGLSKTVLHPSRIEQGLSNSIKTGLGYVGFAVATLAGLSYVGLDITNLAIVAGALSVGIGFGLQSIVNNFVSGLILLVERPVKVGDWIAVGTSQGYVRRISVRSTEIETFDRASVIIPNSELITGSVTNLTHRNALGRVTIRIGVGYETDPEKVQEILLKVAKDCDLVARFPAPFVVFEDFGDSALIFSLRVYLTDINKGLSTQTQLRTDIMKAFRRDGISIPFPQRDLHLRDLDGVKSMVARAAEERLRRAAAGDTSGPADSGETPPWPAQGGSVERS